MKVTDYDDQENEVTRVEYRYDADNQLVGRKVFLNGSGTASESGVFIYHDGQVVLQFDGTGNGDLDISDLSHRYLWGPIVDQLFADEEVNSLTNAALNDTLWALTDHLGTPRDWVNSAGTVVDHAQYDTFGNRLNTAAIDAAFGWTGRYHDPITGLQWNLNRWYNPEIQRWMSEDPIGFRAGDANLVRYVGNTPTMYIDPSGLVELIEIGGGATIIRHKTGVIGISRGSMPGYGIDPDAWKVPSDVYIALMNAQITGNACYVTGNPRIMDALGRYPELYSWEYNNLEEFNRFYKELVTVGIVWGVGLPGGGRPGQGLRPSPIGGGNEGAPVAPAPGPAPTPAPGRPPITRPGYWWSGRYSTPASQPGAYVKSQGRVFPTRRNSGLSGDALRAAQEAFAKTRLCEGTPMETIVGQAREAGLAVLRGPDGSRYIADKGANNAVSRATQWYEAWTNWYQNPTPLEPLPK